MESKVRTIFAQIQHCNPAVELWRYYCCAQPEQRKLILSILITETKKRKDLWQQLELQLTKLASTLSLTSLD